MLRLLRNMFGGGTRQPITVDVPWDMIPESHRNGGAPIDPSAAAINPEHIITGTVVSEARPARSGFLGFGRREARPRVVEIPLNSIPEQGGLYRTTNPEGFGAGLFADPAVEGSIRLNMPPEPVAPPAPRRSWFSRRASAPVADVAPVQPISVDIPWERIPDQYRNGGRPMESFGRGVFPEPVGQNITGTLISEGAPARRGFLGFGRREAQPRIVEIPLSAIPTQDGLPAQSVEGLVRLEMEHVAPAAVPRRSWFSWGRNAAASTEAAPLVLDAAVHTAPATAALAQSVENTVPVVRALETSGAAVVSNVVHAAERNAPALAVTAAATANAAERAGARIVGGMPGSPGVMLTGAAASKVAASNGVGRSIVNFFNPGRSPTLRGVVDGFQKVERDPGFFSYVGHKIGGGTRAVMDAPGKAVAGARSGMTKFAIGAAVVAAGAYIFSALRQSQQNAAMNKAMDKELEAMKGPSLPPVLGADGMVPNQPMPQMAMPEMPAMPSAAAQPAALDPNVQAMANQPFDLPPVSEPVAAASAAPAAEKEDTTFRDKIKAERGGIPGKPQPFVAPKSSLAEAVMSSKDTVVPTLTA